MSSNKNNKAVAEAAKIISMDCLATRTRLINRTLTSIYDEALRPLGLTSNQLTILVVIANRGTISPTEIALLLNMDKSTVSRNVGRMQKSDWLIIEQVESGKGQRLALNSRGRTLIQKSLPLWEQAQSQARNVLGQQGANSIRSIGNAVFSQLGTE
ncbi:MAG: MarR family transcriptional regulator [Kofleriaceae bacterium]|nr:MarR family transcriptional regulator [Kofleriaceae bacterium]